MQGKTKILKDHLLRKAYIYVRQSSPGQVQNNKESGRRQRNLVNLAESLGWSRSKIIVLDRDNAKSGSSSGERYDFKRIVGDVSVEDVGIVLGLEVSRLARNAADWFPLIEMCALTNTLIGDEDGIYDPNDYNDRIILGFKGTFSEAEHRAIKERLQRSRWSLAHRGKLRRRLPLGYIYNEKKEIRKDPNERVRNVIDLFFSKYQELGTACNVVRYFRKNGILFPRRENRGPWDSPIEWKPLLVRIANSTLQNPFYAGVYFYGKERFKQVVDSKTKTRKTVGLKMPMDKWEVFIHNNHPEYISWEEFVKIRKRQAKNRFGGADTSGAPRSGNALLQGLVYCSKCGKQTHIAYCGEKAYPLYVCRRTLDTGVSRYCQSVPAKHIDPYVESMVLEAIKPEGVDATIKVVEELNRRSQEVKSQWEKRIEQAEYEVKLAQKRYKAVDPDNRLVAANLEHEWEESLQELEDLKSEYKKRCSEPPIFISKENKEEIKEILKDIPKLWHAKTTKQEDRKRIVRILIREVWILQEDDPWQTKVFIHWQTGAVTEAILERPLPIAQQVKTPVEVVEQIRELYSKNKSLKWIAEQLNCKRLKTGRGLQFTDKRVAYVLRHWILPSNDKSKGHPWNRTSDKVIRRLRELHEEGNPPSTIAEQANSEGLRTKHGLPFNAMRIKTLLWSRHITGHSQKIK